MSQWGSAKARKVLAALLRIGWTIKRESRGSHRILSRAGRPDVVFAFHDAEEIGPRRVLNHFISAVRACEARLSLLERERIKVRVSLSSAPAM
jgi:predicted RNA binding protein YcfA (HicA-like mRNA interferase family)